MYISSELNVLYSYTYQECTLYFSMFREHIKIFSFIFSFNMNRGINELDNMVTDEVYAFLDGITEEQALDLNLGDVSNADDKLPVEITSKPVASRTDIKRRNEIDSDCQNCDSNDSVKVPVYSREEISKIFTHKYELDESSEEEET